MRASKLVQKHKRIDKFYSGLVTEVCGPPGSGKSRLCYNELITYLHNFPGQGIIIDTTGSFDAAALADLVQSREGTQASLDRIQIMRSFDIYGVIEAIQEIQHMLLAVQREEGSMENQVAGSGIGIVIIDYITNPMSLMMQRGQTPGHDLMVCLSRDLTQLSRRNVCVLVVNTTVKTARDANAGGVQIKNRDVAFDGVTLKPALGSTWPYLVDYSLHIYPVPEGTSRKPGKRGFIQEVVHSRVGGVGEWEMV